MKLPPKNPPKMPTTQPGGGGGSSPPAGLMAAQFVGDAQYARSPAIAIGGEDPAGATNFEVQALVYIEGAYTSGDSVLTVRFPTDQWAGLFVSALFPALALVTSDSQTGVEGPINGALAPTGKWMLLTFSADEDVAPTGLWSGSMESVDGSVAYAASSIQKGIDGTLQGNRVDLNGGGVDGGWTNGIRYAEVRAYNAQRSDVQRQADLTNTDPTGALFWWRFSDDGGGGLAVEDRTGNGILPTIVGGTLATGPTL